MLLAEQSVSWSFCSGLCRCESVSSSNLSRGRTFCNDTSVKRYLVAVFILPCSCCRVIACAKYSAVVPSFFPPVSFEKIIERDVCFQNLKSFQAFVVFCKQAVDAVLDFLRLLVLNDDTAVLGIPSRRNDCCSGADTANFRASGKSQMDGSSSVFVCLILATNNVNGDIHSFTLFAARVSISPFTRRIRVKMRVKNRSESCLFCHICTKKAAALFWQPLDFESC